MWFLKWVGNGSGIQKELSSRTIRAVSYLKTSTVSDKICFIKLITRLKAGRAKECSMTCITQDKKKPKTSVSQSTSQPRGKILLPWNQGKSFCGSDVPLWIFLADGLLGNKGYGPSYPEMCGTDRTCFETLAFPFSCRRKRLISVWCLSNFSTHDQHQWLFSWDDRPKVSQIISGFTERWQNWWFLFS